MNNVQDLGSLRRITIIFLAVVCLSLSQSVIDRHAVAAQETPAQKSRNADALGQQLKRVTPQRDGKATKSAMALVETILAAGDETAGNDFGYAAAVAGDTLVVGAPRAEVAGEPAGAVYVFQREETRWEQRAKLVASDGAAGDMFGYSVDVSGNTLAVGALFADGAVEETGAVYMFQQVGNEWLQMSKLIAGQGRPFDRFGHSVAVDGTTAVVGAPGQDRMGADAGLVYRYELVGEAWTAYGYVVSSQVRPYDYFGHRVALSEGRAAVSAHGDDTLGTSAGAVYIFPLWVNGAQDAAPVWKLTANDGAANDFFGFALDLAGDVLAVGAYGDDDNGSYSGSVYTINLGLGFETNTAQQKLTAGDGRPYAQFGRSVAITDGMLIAGAPYDDTACDDCGAAYVFMQENGTWQALSKLMADDGNLEDQFGAAVAVNGETAVAGAIRVDDEYGEPEAGRAYVYQWAR